MRSLTPPTLDQALRSATATTFDRVDSDGCMSTNDTVLLLASGASGVSRGRGRARRGGDRGVRRPGRQLVADAEGASKDIADRGDRAATRGRRASRSAGPVARSNLLKCALHGEDPNWGRVLAAVGTTTRGVRARRSSTSAINGVWVCRRGAAGERPGLVDLSGREIDDHRRPARRRRDRRPSGPTTSRRPTSTRTRRTPHEPAPWHAALREGRHSSSRRCRGSSGSTAGPSS